MIQMPEVGYVGLEGPYAVCAARPGHFLGLCFCRQHFSLPPRCPPSPAVTDYTVFLMPQDPLEWPLACPPSL